MKSHIKADKNYHHLSINYDAEIDPQIQYIELIPTKKFYLLSLTLLTQFPYMPP